MHSLLETLGLWAAVPVATAALAGYGISLLTGMHRTKSQQRVEFLEIWNCTDAADDMKLEVLVRHLCGTYLPATVIRRLCAKDNCAAAIVEVAQVWAMYRYDSDSKKVDWANAKYYEKNALRNKSVLFHLGYFAFAFLSFGFAAAALSSGPKDLISWICGLNTVLMLVVAVGSLAKAETFSLADKHGRSWMEKLNGQGQERSATN